MASRIASPSHGLISGHRACFAGSGEENMNFLWSVLESKAGLIIIIYFIYQKLNLT